MNGNRTGRRGMAAVAAGMAAVLAAGTAGGRPASAAEAATPAGAAAGMSAAKPATRAITITRFLGEQRLPHLMKYRGTTVGGLSGIDRDPRTGKWYMVSDDRWRYDAARFYTGRLDIDPATGRFTGAGITGVTTFQQPDGTPYPGFGKPGSTDPETIRVDPRGGRLLWGDEGDRRDAAHPGIPLSELAVRWTGRDGRYQGRLPIPGGLRLTEEEAGPRRNSGFEAVTFSPHGIAAMVEGPRYEDGEPPSARRGAPARLTLWSRDGSRVRGQYAYPIGPLPAEPVPAGGDADSGVSEILAIDDHRYLALERSWIQGVGYRVGLYEFDVRRATDVLWRRSLEAGGGYRPVSKRLVADMGDFGRGPTQNLESLAWGPRLRSGECSLVAGSDDNFDEREVTQFLAFAVRGC